jgi:hypothetical protein
MIRETPPWGDMDRDAYIAQIVQTGWRRAKNGTTYRHSNASDDAGLPCADMYADKSNEVPGFTQKAWFCRSSALGHVPPQFDKTRAKAAARLIRAAMDMAKKDAAAAVVTA